MKDSHEIDKEQNINSFPNIEDEKMLEIKSK